VASVVKRVEVEWVDSFVVDDGSWMDIVDIDPHLSVEAMVCRTVGFLARDEHDAIAVVGSVDEHETPPRVMCTLIIPRRAIVAIKTLDCQDSLLEAA
jgi:hypothetical protein